MQPTAKIYGPYEHNGGWRCQLKINGRRTWAPMADSSQRAEQLAERFRDGLFVANPVTVEEAIEEYRGHLRTKGNKADSIDNTTTKLRRFFRPVLVSPVLRVTKARAAGLYEDLRTCPSERTGKPLATDSHRNILAESKTFLAWCVTRRWLSSNPLAEVKGVGKRRHGKPQLRIDEGRRLRDLCHRLASAGEDGPIAVLMAMFMGLRAGEVVHCTARDLDDGGRLLWIADSKTEAGKRAIEVPPELRGYLIARSQGKPHDALIFPSKYGGPHWRDWVAEQTRRLCRLARVPVVNAQSLRGFVATVAVQAGRASQDVIATMGHRDISTTLRSYAAPGSAQIAEQRRALDVLGAASAGSTAGTTRASILN